ncbi:hypothetical protein [Mesorhizobium sp.]|uniref:hypothetical protein n=1 Tax=Mesorhizobium sp. TaxID=1871066 RepID=UPI000FE4C0E6|nr:hypothetical protein [Mesorhizobium sp.]RWQ13599.1 MAG: hypothetical protein EOR93_31560 [Mesorhizobium sp.]
MHDTFRKDATLDRLAERFNVAQFVSFAPSTQGPLQQFCRILDLPPNMMFDTLDAAVETLFERSGEGSVNIRSFSEHRSQSREFLYGLRTLDEVVGAVKRLSAEGSFTIINETIDVSDGGVSGVCMNGLVEFRPDSTPRGVEKPGFATLSHEWAKLIFTTVYGFQPDIDAGLLGRLEFSLHPLPRGWKRAHVVHWEFGPSSDIERHADPQWPNDFSRMLGDKAYGLLIADAIGVPVPKTTVIGRRVAPFSFGQDTGSFERWIRTSPTEQVPGKFTTLRGWSDPFLLLQQEDPSHLAIASVLAQQGVPALWSGAAIEDAAGKLVIEGTPGSGEAFMKGIAAPQRLPESATKAVTATHLKLRSSLGPVRFEWVYDGRQLWVVQLHEGRSSTAGTTIVPGDPDHWVIFEITRGLEQLRDFVSKMPPRTGLVLDGQVGLTSHIADVIRKANIPAKMGGSAEGQGS